MTTLYEQIQAFYDASSGLWESVWGEHMHHGYYGADGQTHKERRQAQIDLIDAVVDWAGLERLAPEARILDVGCGIGGSSLYLAEKFGAIATGITLSPVQANRATERAAAAGLSQRASFQVANALAMPFANDSFDLVWSLESGEHMPDKTQFMQECLRVLKPGGTLVLVTWCHRDLQEGPLSSGEQALLEAIYQVYCLPYVLSLAEYEAIARHLNIQNLQTADWSTAVAPFWDVVIDSALTPAALLGLAQSGWTTIQAALGLGLMQQGYRSGLIRFGLLQGHKL
jgi:tocopherol O-methyltransferase